MSIQQQAWVFFYSRIPCRSLLLPKPSVFQFSMRCASLLFPALHPTLFQMPISDKDAKLYRFIYVGTRSFSLHTSFVCFRSRLHKDAPKKNGLSISEGAHIVENMSSARFPYTRVVMVPESADSLVMLCSVCRRRQNQDWGMASFWSLKRSSQKTTYSQINY